MFKYFIRFSELYDCRMHTLKHDRNIILIKDTEVTCPGVTYVEL